MSAGDALRDYITPLLPGFRVQFGRWMDGNNEDRYAVIQPAGGLPAELVREPQFTLRLIGSTNDAAPAINAFADTVIEQMRLTSGADLVFLQPSEPVFVAASDGRPIFEIAISAIAN